MIVGLGLLYRVAVSESRPGWLGFVTPGTIVAAVLWLVVSALFALFVLFRLMLDGTASADASQEFRLMLCATDDGCLRRRGRGLVS